MPRSGSFFFRVKFEKGPTFCTIFKISFFNGKIPKHGKHMFFDLFYVLMISCTGLAMKKVKNSRKMLKKGTFSTKIPKNRHFATVEISAKNLKRTHFEARKKCPLRGTPGYYILSTITTTLPIMFWNIKDPFHL